MDFFTNFYRDQSIKGEKVNYIFRWILVALILVIAVSMYLRPYTREASKAAVLLTLVAASYNAVLSFLFAKKLHFGWIKYASVSLDVAMLCAYIYLASLSSPTAVATSSTQLIYPLIIFFAALRIDRKLIIYSLCYILVTYNLTYALGRGHIPQELFEQVYLLDWDGQIFRSAYILLFGVLIITFPSTILSILRKQEAMFSGAFGNYRKLADNVSVKTGELFSSSAKLDREMASAAQAIHAIAETAGGAREGMLSQDAMVEQTGKATGRLAETIDRLASLLDKQSSMIRDSSGTITSVLDDLDRVLQEAVQAVSLSAELEKAAKAGGDTIRSMIGGIQTMSGQSASLIETAGVMTGIAETTSLLAVNASIEAAHAGKSGAGFIVVAGEIRKLAEQTKAQSEQISLSLGAIKEGIDLATRHSGGAGEAFHTIEEKIRTVAGIIGNVRAAVEEEDKRGRAIGNMLSLLEDLTASVKEESTGMEGANDGARDSVRRLKEANTSVQRGVASMLASVDGVASAVARVNQMTKENRELIASVAKQVEGFEIVGQKET